jgi:heterodisulfide reductase subunit B
MPIRDRHRYPKNWKEISRYVRFERAQGRCEFCGAHHKQPNPHTGKRAVLAAMHLDHIPENSRNDNLMAGCNRCHLNYDRSYHMQERERRRNRAMERGGQLRLAL